MAVQFYLNGELREVAAVAPTTTVLDYLREIAVLTGTKEGCAEGDCGACAIVIANAADERPVYLAVNACLLMVPQLDGKHVYTVEGLTERNDGLLDPVQEAMVQSDGTQCGFCTPGFIMSMFALRHSNEEVSDEVIHDALAGNLCRCTGYRPIVDSMRDACLGTRDDDELVDELAVVDTSDTYQIGSQSFFAPTNLTAMAELFARHPDAHILGGGTDLGILVSKDRQAFKTVIHTAQVIELREIREDGDTLTIGAAITYTEALPYIDRLYPSFATMIKRIGSRQIRNVGTIGGNVGNASPIGDTPPCLIALDATLVLHSEAGDRAISVEDYFLDYRKTDLKDGEFIKEIRIPKLKPGQDFRTFKISKRYDQDISAVIGAYRIGIDGEKIVDARIAYGGMAATPKRAPAAEAALTGKSWKLDTALAAAAAVGEDYSPISDHRAGKEYRSKVAGNLFLRLYHDLSGIDKALEVMAV